MNAVIEKTSVGMFLLCKTKFLTIFVATRFAYTTWK